MPNEKRKPHYSLARIQALMQHSESRRITSSSLDGARNLGWGRDEILQCVQRLTRSDFYKSMTSYHNSQLWQDVYLPIFKGKDLYVKVQILPGEQGVVISFKERLPGGSP